MASGDSVEGGATNELSKLIAPKRPEVPSIHEDRLLGHSDCISSMSEAFMKTMIACAGFTYATRQLDRDSVDISVISRGRLVPESDLLSTQLDIQLKGTMSPKIHGGKMSHRISVKNYNDLREPKLMIPRILVVMAIDEDRKNWLNCHPERFEGRAFALYHYLWGLPEADDQDTVTVKLPTSNLLSVETLKELMVRVSLGRLGEVCDAL